jgi:hypothetical protein
VRVFSYNSLRSATDSFHPTNRIGGGGYGVVFKVIKMITSLTICLNHVEVLLVNVVKGFESCREF